MAGPDPIDALGDTIRALEKRLDARIGLFLRDSGTGWEWAHRPDERFLMASTFKSVLCGAVLERVDQGQITLDEGLDIRAGEIHGHAPVTENRVGESLRVDELCLATLDQSDNGAANLLIDRLGGPEEVTAFLRRIGDETTRLDRKEPALNLFAPGDPRDTTSPRAMAQTWETLLLGDVLQPESRALLAGWMSLGGVTGPLLRVHAPQDWAIADRSGGGRSHTRNIVAMITPPGRAPWFVAIYLSDTPANWSTRNAAVSELGAAVVKVIAAAP
ncbi:class A beta-lactamase [Neogemmobacter tilapiae]|uniref:Beta-lactamase n=1 Tax=Neogemmobacter tilapiae TaxID=875041 RepID=A0A918WNQ4_9RHOB|nr:class A beta-lactamase [Gemmobacter tilapiae]GHC63327.1 beta-lactamase [Gemmobacter tilapiae]